jgi:hypothetical protein
MTAGYGSGSFYNDEPNGIQVDNSEHDGWIVCEWYHGDNAPVGYADEPLSHL